MPSSSRAATTLSCAPLNFIFNFYMQFDYMSDKICALSRLELKTESAKRDGENKMKTEVCYPLVLMLIIINVVPY
jgi:hypothetical protein